MYNIISIFISQHFFTPHLRTVFQHLFLLQISNRTGELLSILARLSTLMVQYMVPGDEYSISTDRLTLYTSKDVADSLLGKTITIDASKITMPTYCDLMPTDNRECDDIILSLSVSRLIRVMYQFNIYRVLRKIINWYTIWHKESWTLFVFIVGDHRF